MSNNNSNARNRKRTREAAASFLLPEIPGIPMEVLPLHIHAIKWTTAMFRKQQQQQTTELTIVPPYEQQSEQTENHEDEEDLRMTATTRKETLSVMDTVLNRMENAANESDPLRQQQMRELQQAKQRQKQAMNEWLQAIRRLCRSGRKDEEQRDDRETNSVPIACVRHLMTFHTEKEKNQSIAMLRAKTHLAGHLLEKSADARRWFIEQNNQLLQWMDEVVVGMPNHDTEDETIRALWQQESFLLLHHLQHKFGNWYPTLLTAVQRFQQLRPDIGSVTVNNNHSLAVPAINAKMSMVELRKLRDLALQHAEQEQRKVRKLLRQAYDCTDILVPRVTQDMNNDSGKSNDNNVLVDKDKDDDDDDDDDESIDWEDGCTHGDAQEHDEEKHGAAVEQTLATMEFSGKLKNGELEINFAEDTQQVTTHGENHLKARKRFEEVVNKLSKKHMPRLSSWVDALNQADGLIEVQPSKNSISAGSAMVGESERASACLVSMSASQAKRRTVITKLLIDLKQEVASVLFSAKRFGINSDNNSLNTSIVPQSSAPTVLRERMIDLPRRIQSMTTPQHRARKKYSSNRIQIKYRKNH